jgi:tRNA threonylcarbamoyladenosine biosynthesis protein TsaE
LDLPFEQDISNIEETKLIATELSKLFNRSDVVVFNGNLGSGKTTLIKYLCTNYSINEVNSPSFSIVNEYIGERKVYHFDFYRLNKIEELYDIGFEEYLMDQDAIVFIEWGNLMPDILPSNYYEIELELFNKFERTIKVSKKN